MKEAITKKEECLKNYLKDTEKIEKQRNGKEKTATNVKIVISNRKEKMRITRISCA